MYNENNETLVVKQRKYSKQKNRTRKINNVALISITFLEALLIFALFIQTFVSKTSYGKMGIVPILVLIIGVIVNWISYMKDNSSEKFKYIMGTSFLIGWGYIMVTGKNVLVTSYVYPVLIATILYHDIKFEKIIFYTSVGFTAFRTIVWAFSGYLFNSQDSIALISTVVGFVILIVVHITAVLSERFNHDMVHSVKDEQNTQNIMLQDILRISKSVKEEVINTDKLIENLKNSSIIVHSSIKEVSASTQVTAESVQEQTRMTTMINDDIEETAENAKVMVEAATNSAKMMEENMIVINNIRENAESIGETNSNVAKSMEELQKKAKEVQQITEVIFSISNQTNLLALNASIESARAGEAGKGFAVVADQIRKLAEETRKSTEKISGIIQELNINAQNATEIVQSSIDAMSHQNSMVENASDGFTAIRNNMDTLTQSVEDIDGKIKNLVKSNNTIIDNISQLSAISEEVSASAKEVEIHSLQNQTESQQAKELLNKVQGLVQEFAKYQNMSEE